MQWRWLLVFSITACSSNGGSAVDSTPVIDIDNGSCGDMLNYTGELVDWDSTMGMFCGVNAATYDASGTTDTTAPNGRFELCIQRSGVTNVTVTPGAANSGCAMPASPYMLPMIAVANPATILAGGFWSGRVFTTARQATYFQAIGQTFDAAKAHVVVHVDGNPRAVALLATHGATQAFNGTAWAAGESGRDVYFPNVDVPATGGTTMLTVVGGAIGTGPIPIQAGKVTLVSVLTR